MTEPTDPANDVNATSPEVDNSDPTAPTDPGMPAAASPTAPQSAPESPPASAPNAPDDSWQTSTAQLGSDYFPTTQIPEYPSGDQQFAQGPPPQQPTFAPPAAPKPKQPTSRFARNVAAVTGIVLLSGLSGVTGAAVFNSANNNDANFPVTNTSLDSKSTSTLDAGSVEKVAAAVLPSTVKINVAGAGSAGQGTGVIISEDGTIVTNNHVIESAAQGGQITVVFHDGTNASAKIVGRDAATDIAVIKASGVSDLKPAMLGSSSNLQVGQRVVAIGSPFGLEATVTEGIISALNRPVSPGETSASGSTQTIFPAIQTDAAINPGNSGGPLVDLAGRVIGINSAISTGGGGTGSVGLGFAIPINLVSSVSEQILSGQKVEHARIGVQVIAARGDDNITEIGAQIGDVTPGSAGDLAGLKSGDIVTGVDGHPIATSDGLVATIRGYRPGDEVTLTILRDGKSQEVKLTLGSDRN